MIRKSVRELLFQISRGPVPTVEVDLDSIPEGRFEIIISNALATVAAGDPGLLATVYTHATTSANFGAPCYSAFVGVAGRESLLKVIHSAFSALAGARVRYGDYIIPVHSRREYHVEDGKVWLAEDATSWYVFAPEGQEAGETEEWVEDNRWSPDTDASRDEERTADIDTEDLILADTDEVAGQPVTGARRSAARFRAARSDATVASIRQKIERMFGLPEGSVALCGPDKAPLRGDAKIGTLRRRWE